MTLFRRKFNASHEIANYFNDNWNGSDVPFLSLNLGIRKKIKAKVFKIIKMETKCVRI